MELTECSLYNKRHLVPITERKPGIRRPRCPTKLSSTHLYPALLDYKILPLATRVLNKTTSVLDPIFVALMIKFVMPNDAKGRKGAALAFGEQCAEAEQRHV